MKEIIFFTLIIFSLADNLKLGGYPLKISKLIFGAFGEEGKNLVIGDKKTVKFSEAIQLGTYGTDESYYISVGNADFTSYQFQYIKYDCKDDKKSVDYQNFDTKPVAITGCNGCSLGFNFKMVSEEEEFDQAKMSSLYDLLKENFYIYRAKTASDTTVIEYKYYVGNITKGNYWSNETTGLTSKPGDEYKVCYSKKIKLTESKINIEFESIDYLKFYRIEIVSDNKKEIYDISELSSSKEYEDKNEDGTKKGTVFGVNFYKKDGSKMQDGDINLLENLITKNKKGIEDYFGYSEDDTDGQSYLNFGKILVFILAFALI